MPSLPKSNELSDAERKREFTKYVVEITDHQRQVLANRVLAMQKHMDRHSYYLFGSLATAIAGTFVGLYFWGPRHLTNHRVYLIRPVGPALAIGTAFYCMLYPLRLGLMKLRFWNQVEDYEYELKRAHAHHVEEGLTHLAWMQFVLDQVRCDKTPFLDIDAMKRGPYK